MDSNFIRRRGRRGNNLRRGGTSIRTHTDFDESIPFDRPDLNSIIQSNSSSATKIHKSKIHSLLVQSLLEEFCCSYESDPQKRCTLFHSLCEELYRAKFIDESFGFEELSVLRNHFRTILTRLVMELQKKIPDLESEHPVATSLSHSVNTVERSVSLNSDIVPNLNLNRYERDFIEEGSIGIGGFGEVCKAWKRGDDCMYAVKKIPFTYSDMEKYLQVSREVKTLAKLNHPNVVSYKCSWIENHQSIERPENSSNDETSSTSREGSITIYRGSNKGIETNSDPFHKDSFATASYNYNNFKELNTVRTGISDSSVSLEEFQNITCNNEFKKHTKITLETKKTNITFRRESVSDPSADRSRHSSGTSHISSPSEVDEDFELQPSDSEKYRLISWDSTTSKALLPVTNPLKSLNVDGTMYIQMELCSSSLRDWLTDRNEDILSTKNNTFDCVDEEEVMNLFCQLLKGINHIHSQNIIHRDLTPQNIFFDLEHQKIKIGDFGLATMCSLINDQCCKPWEECEGHSQGVGTTPYAAPEQRTKKNYDNKVDMYSLGIIFFELLHPFGSGMERSMCIDKLKKGKIPEDLSKRWPQHCDIILKLVNSDPHKRPSASDVMETYPYFTKKKIITNLKNEITDLKETQTRDSKKLQKLIKIKDEKYKEVRILRRQNKSLRRKIFALKSEVLGKDDEIRILKRRLSEISPPSLNSARRDTQNSARRDTLNSVGRENLTVLIRCFEKLQTPYNLDS